MVDCIQLCLRLKVASLEDLARRAPELSFGTDIEFPLRPEWKAVQSAYGLKFRRLTSYQPTFMYRALEDGQADVISAFSSDGRIDADHLVVLADPRRALPPYDAVILISPRHAHDPRLIAALQPLVGSIDAAAMRRANYAVDRPTNKLTPAQAAETLGPR